MKKNLFAFLAFLSFFSLTQVSFAQFGVGGGLNYTRYMGDFGQGNSGIHLRLFYNTTDRVTIVGGFNYGLPIKSSYTSTASAFSSTTVPQYKNINVDSKLSLKTFQLQLNYFFVGDNEEDFGLYGLAGAALVNVRATSTSDSYDHTLYDGPESDEVYSENAFMIHAGLGAQYSFGALALFGEGILGIPANRVGNAEVDVTVPFNAGINLGLKYTFGQ